VIKDTDPHTEHAYSPRLEATVIYVCMPIWVPWSRVLGSTEYSVPLNQLITHCIISLPRRQFSDNFLLLFLPVLLWQLRLLLMLTALYLWGGECSYGFHLLR